MQLEVIRCVADYLADATNGVNALIPGVTRDSGDPQPALVSGILDETRGSGGEIAAFKRIPADVIGPFVLVWMGAESDVQAVNQSKQYVDSFPVEIAYVDRDINANVAVRDGAYVMRAVRKSLNRFHQNASLANRTRNNIEVRNGNIRMRVVRPELQIESAILIGGIRCIYAVSDMDP
jgi:hypothetical protein